MSTLLPSPAQIAAGMPPLDSDSFGHPTTNCQIIETHISWVVLTGEWVYKFKKPVRFDFLDFSTPELRTRDCWRELQINQQLGSTIYESVQFFVPEPRGWRRRPAACEQGLLPIAGEPAVRLRQFPQTALLSFQLQHGDLTPLISERLGAELAAIHARLPPAQGSAEEYCATTVRLAQENWQYLLKHGTNTEKITRLATWTQEQQVALRPLLKNRWDGGWVRECHGDLHCDNVLYWHDRFELFDALEFNDDLRRIDVLNDVAFLLMELSERGHPAHAHRVLNRYLEATGEYRGLELLPFFQVYRALVRAKVDLIRQLQMSSQETASGSPHGEKYLAYAVARIAQKTPQLLLMFGFSGSGKSTVAGQLVEQRGLLRLRADVTRKRLAGCADPTAPSPREQWDEIYSAEFSRRVYARLLQDSRQILQGGLSVVVDATFLRRSERQHFYDLAQELGLPVLVVACQAPEEELTRRLVERQGDPSDATPEIARKQIEDHDPLAGAELAWTVSPRDVLE